MAKRRRHGEGSVYRRKSDGMWCGVADFGYREGEDGIRRRVRKTVTASTEREATRKLRKLIRDADQGVVPVASTVESWLMHWLENIAPYQSRQLKRRTLQDYRWQVTRHIIPRIGTRRLRDLSPDDVRALHAAQRAAGLSPTSIRQTHAILSRALDVALKEGKVSRNVAATVDAPGALRNPHPVLSAAEAEHVIRSASANARLRARLALALEGGIRQGEALGLQWSDMEMDSEGWVIHVRRTVQRIVGEGLVVGTPKTAGSVRTVPLEGIAPMALLAWREESGGRGFIFPGHKGPLVPEDPRRDYQAWRDALADAGVRHVPLHGARGSTASILQAKGVPDRVIADILGHAKVQTSQEHYLHSDATQRRAAIRAAFGEIGA